MQEDAVDAEIFEERIQQAADAVAAEKASLVDAETWKGIEKSVLLQTLDHHWKEHLATLDALRQVVFLRAYAQKQPINEYKQEAFALFERMLSNIREDVTRTVARIDLRFEEPEPMPLPALPASLTTHIDPSTGQDSSRATIIGRSTAGRWTRCVRSCSCAPMRRSSRSTNISRKPSRCSSACCRISARM